MKKQLTIIVPVYNIAKYLPRFFDSILNQTFSDFSLVMIDDGSSDDSLDCCKEYATKDDRIRVIESQHLGVTAARNIAISSISTPYTAFADGDDFVEPDYLKHLMDTREKYDADLVISRVNYLTEGLEPMGEFPKRGEMIINQDEFAKKLPMLLDDRRLNYLYGKVYRSDILKNIRVEDDVRQGSDTMLNSQFVGQASSIVLIDDLDYNYIKYNTRSVTSYNGTDAYDRICRINSFLYKTMERNGFLTDEMKRIIDGRVLQSAIWCAERVLSDDSSVSEKKNQIKEMVNKDIYASAWNAQKNELSGYSFSPIDPTASDRYVNKFIKEKRIEMIKGKVRPFLPDFLMNLYNRCKE